MGGELGGGKGTGGGKVFVRVRMRAPHRLLEEEVRKGRKGEKGGKKRKKTLSYSQGEKKKQRNSLSAQKQNGPQERKVKIGEGGEECPLCLPTHEGKGDAKTP